MLSPYWKVEKEKADHFRARARALSFEYGNTLLFDFEEERISKIPDGYKISNRYMRGGASDSIFTVDIVFHDSPRVADLNIYHKGEPTILDVYERYANEIGLNSYSTLMFELSSSHNIYLLVREQGDDLDRKITFEYIPKILGEIERINGLPADYSVKQTYSEFFQLVFDKIEEDELIRRHRGLQDRDTFFGYFQASEDVTYEGINIKISHPVFCDGECTRASSRLRKAEYLGVPYRPQDILFFQIEDNAVYLAKEEYDQKYGTFSGDERFEGNLIVTNDRGIVVYETTDYFKGWER